MTGLFGRQPSALTFGKPGKPQEPMMIPHRSLLARPNSRAGNLSPSDDIERAKPTGSSDAGSDGQRLLRLGDAAAARRPTDAREPVVQALVATAG